MYEQTTGMGFTNWRTSPGDPCSQVSGGQQRCFRTTTVDGHLPEQDFARVQGCVPRGEACSTSYGNPGLVWCCPPGWPLQPGSPPLDPGEQPPEAPIVSPAMMQMLPWLAVAGAAVAGAAGFGFWYWQRGR